MGRGRGPTRLIWPRNTLRSWGNSSRDVNLRKAPTLVTRGSFLILKTGPFISFKDSSSAFFISAFECMVRNLYMVKGSPCRPLRLWRKSAGPGDSSLMASQMARKTGAKRSRRNVEAIRSKRILIKDCQVPARVERKTRRFRFMTSSNWARAIWVPTKSVLSQLSTPSSSQALMAWAAHPMFFACTSRSTMPTESS